MFLPTTPTSILITVAVLFSIYALGIPLLILSTFRQAANPELEIVDELLPLPDVVEEQFSVSGSDLEAMGFAAVETMFLPNQIENVRAIVRLYENTSEQASAMLVSMFACVDNVWDLQSIYCEFNTRLNDGSDFNTNNSNEVSAFKSSPKTTTTRIPWIEDSRELYRAHDALVKSLTLSSTKRGSLRKELRRHTVFHGDAAAYVGSAMQDELAQAAKDGYLKMSSDQQSYTPTFFGAYRMTWPQIQPFKYLARAKSDRIAKSRLAKAGFQAA